MGRSVENLKAVRRLSGKQPQEGPVAKKKSRALLVVTTKMEPEGPAQERPARPSALKQRAPAPAAAQRALAEVPAQRAPAPAAKQRARGGHAQRGQKRVSFADPEAAADTDSAPPEEAADKKKRWDAQQQSKQQRVEAIETKRQLL